LINKSTFVPLMPREWHLLFAVGQKVGKNPTAAPDASEVSDLAWFVSPAPAKAEKKVNGDLLRGLKKRTYRTLTGDTGLRPGEQTSKRIILVSKLNH